MADIKIESVTKRFGDFLAVDNVSLTIEDQEFMVLLGPSGCGKTTLLRAVAGLGMADEGRISIGGKDVTYLPPRQRGISMVFQSYAIFPHMKVYDNIAFGLKMNKVDKAETERRVRQAAELLHIENMLDRYPSKMSGGQRQRVAVARAIAMKSQVLLMDEPLSNLDALLRLEMRAELKRLLAEIQATTIYVTHDQIEALSMGDRIAVMRNGTILQCDHPTIVYDQPATEFVGGFIGNPPMNFLDAQVQRHNGSVDVAIGDFKLAPHALYQPVLKPYDGKPIVIGIRAENMETLSTPSDDAIKVRVLVVEPLGSQNLLTVKIGANTVKVSTHPSFAVAPDQDVWLRFPAEKIRWVDRDSGQMLYPAAV
ncbi:MAG: ABC transporter ATP-binding protein [Caldilinea sp.]|nr:ABC transporter ATP-binding protein [Caldilinea sp.]MCB0056796.1 ABC transporter ATP-binding protein [Caldilineaceae bacterium]MCB9116756.1 ABC transporter ATP-binding protein [Caldilineaceae bacterium]MCB9121082.1 ABC transporter ATP-binding protein [Caldilineaceae bacterium]MCB9124739.1 ABC transporter ATP-binding protein [Caldilineaceae bacterium]